MNVSAVVPLPPAYSAHFSSPAFELRSIFSRGVPVTTAAAVKVSSTRIFSPSPYVSGVSSLFVSTDGVELIVTAETSGTAWLPSTLWPAS